MLFLKNSKKVNRITSYNVCYTKLLRAILLFRVGDFYETFGDDAVKAAEILGITLTRRANGSASYNFV